LIKVNTNRSIRGASSFVACEDIFRTIVINIWITFIFFYIQHAFHVKVLNVISYY